MISEVVTPTIEKKAGKSSVDMEAEAEFVGCKIGVGGDKEVDDVGA